MVVKKSIRKEIAGIIVVIALAIFFAFFVSLMSEKNYIPQQYLLPIYLLIIVITGYVWIRIITEILEKLVEPRIGETRTHGIKNLFYVIAAIVLIVIISSLFGVNIGSILVGAGFAGIVLGLAAQQVLGNIFGGLSLLASRPFEIGDRITLVTSSYGLMGESYSHENMLNGFTGVITDVTIFFTRMQLDEGTPAVFPNSVVVGSLVVNHARVTFRMVRVRIDLDKKLEFESFKSNFIQSLTKYNVIDNTKTKMETVDVGGGTYQVAINVWAKSEYEEPIKTIVIQNAVKIQNNMMNALSKAPA